MVKMTEEVVKATHLPVTVKTRLGWDEQTKNIVEVAERLQDIGIQALSVHGRTRVQMYKGEANWELIGKIKENPCSRGGRVYASTRVDNVWSFEQEETFLKSAPAHLQLPLLLGLWTGQREGDLLRLPWSAYDGTRIRLRPRKTITKRRPKGTTVVIPVGAPLKAALDEAAKHKVGPVVLTSTDKRPWTEGGFRASWRKACAKAGIVQVTFNDLRGTAVTRLALVGCSEPEIASITGHSLRDVRSILDQHYLHRDPALAASAIRKLEDAVSANKTG